jgi:hypothetical protein
LDESDHVFKQRGLSGAALTHDEENLALSDFEVDVLLDNTIAKDHIQSVNLIDRESPFVACG